MTLDTARKRMARWRILRILLAGRPYPVGQGLISQVLTDADLMMTDNEIVSSLQYLEDKGYIETKEVTVAGEGKHLEARLSSRGVDFIEYTLPDDPGIARPALA